MLIAENIGGKAERDKRMAIYGKNGADWNFGVAHEIGHMFDLEHNREEFDDCCLVCFPCKITLNNLDDKKAYGFRGTTYKTVMSYGSQTRRGIYSDESFNFPDGETAGNSRAHAKIYIENHIGNVLKNSDKDNIIFSNETISSDQMLNLYANNSIIASDINCESGSNVKFQAGNSIILESGFKVEAGAIFSAKIENCDNSFGFKSAKKVSNDNLTDASISNEIEVTKNILVYPNPFKNYLNIIINEEIKIKSISIIDNTGRIIFFQELNNISPLISLDVDFLNEGTYYVKLDEGKKSFSSKIIKK